LDRDWPNITGGSFGKPRARFLHEGCQPSSAVAVDIKNLKVLFTGFQQTTRVSPTRIVHQNVKLTELRNHLIDNGLRRVG
jgi:hypothetical protein